MTEPTTPFDDDVPLQLAQAKAERKLERLAQIYCDIPPEDREAVQDGIEYERWLADSCREARQS